MRLNRMTQQAAWQLLIVHIQFYEKEGEIREIGGIFSGSDA